MTLSGGTRPPPKLELTSSLPPDTFLASVNYDIIYTYLPSGLLENPSEMRNVR